MRHVWKPAALVTAGALLAACGAQSAENAGGSQSYTASLAAPEGVESEGTGTGEFTFNPETGELSYTIEHSGLTGPAAAAHIHGPADPGANAGVAVPFSSAESPITGTATLTEEQAAELEAGRYYVNVHTAANPAGEIRGQITAE